MPRYRCDTQTQNPDGSISHYANWIGGPTLAKVSNCLTEDGTRRTVTITGPNDSFFSIPAYTTRRGHRITGFLTTGDFGRHQGAYIFISTDSTNPISDEYRTMLNFMVDQHTPWFKMSPRYKLEALAFIGFPYNEPWYHWQ